MREMILNHASLVDGDQCVTIGWWEDIARGMAKLTQYKVVRASLRMYELSYPLLHQIYQEIRKSGAHEEYLFLMRLITKMPLLDDFAEEVKSRLPGCEAEAFQLQERKPLSSGEMEPLLLCALVNGIAVGPPSDPCWDSDLITVAFKEILPDTTIQKVSEKVDNLARSIHADPIRERNRAQIRTDAGPQDLWEKRKIVFPHLMFGLGVKANILNLSTHFLNTVVKKLGALDESAKKWCDVGGAAPPWTCLVTPESDTVMNSQKLRKFRLFESLDGTPKMYEWHARFGSGGRIHFRFDATTREVEIGYIGQHLPL